MQLFIPENINFVLNTLKKSGFDAYLVGGCVRDMLMGKIPHDFDVTTSALPNQVEALFEKTVSTGIKHGTVTVIVDETPIEVTTFRTEGSYSDNRRPDSVEFVTDIKYDLSRRDFTVNAMAYNKHNGLIDLFDGQADLKNGILKAVGNPEKRFREDALRILRLYRFASVLGFNIEEKTKNAADLCAQLLKNVSVERILTELTKAVCGNNTFILNELIKSGGLTFLNINRFEDLSALSRLKNDSRLRLFAFLKLTDCNIIETLNLLKASNIQKKYCIALNEMSDKSLPETKGEIKQFLREYGKDAFCGYLDFLTNIGGVSTEKAEKLLCEIESNREPYLISDLKIDGNRLKELGLCGEEIKLALNNLVLSVSDNPQLNKEEILIELIKKTGN